MKKIFSILIFLLLISFANHSVEYSFLWWNVENFFDMTDDPRKDDTILSKQEFQIKLNKVCTIISKIDADFVGLCEVENVFVLKLIAQRCSYKYFYLVEGNDPRGIDIAFLSKNVVTYTTHRDQLTPYEGNKHYKFSRDCPEVSFSTPYGEFYILLNHLKSQYRADERTKKKRIAQTFGILDIINHIYQQENEPFVLVMGDFNCGRYSEPLNILQKSGLYILNYDKNPDSFYTYIYKKQKNDLDYFIMNKFLYTKVKIISLDSIHSQLIKETSDHYPIILKFKFK